MVQESVGRRRGGGGLELGCVGVWAFLGKKRTNGVRQKGLPGRHSRRKHGNMNSPGCSQSSEKI